MNNNGRMESITQRWRISLKDASTFYRFRKYPCRAKIYFHPLVREYGGTIMGEALTFLEEFRTSRN